MMGFAVERPYAFFALLVIPPVVLYMVHRCSLVIKALGGQFDNHQSDAARSFYRFRHAVKIRSTCFIGSWCMLVCAFAGISWGAISVPVQRGGNAVIMVFDISYSMQATDMPQRVTRLSAASRYAQLLLPRLEGTSVGVVIAKGDGIQMLPLTEDAVAISNLLANLSPEMSAATGSSLGKGIKAAIRAFPSDIARKQSIWVFTDGDETDGALAGALNEASLYGISVSIIGFGQTRETFVLAGDGQTRVKTALRADRIQSVIANVPKKESVSLRYIEATNSGSAVSLLQDIELDKKEGVISFETERVDRHGLFLLLAIVLFIIGFVSNELDLHALFKKLRGLLGMSSLVVILILFSSCRIDVMESKRIAQSTWNWHQKKYRQATSGFLHAKENALENNNADILLYARYGLGATYIMQDENAAAYDYFSSIPEDAPDTLRFGAIYNLGVIAYRRGDFATAADCFKSALLIDSTNTNAKINLELAVSQQVTKRSHGEAPVARSVSENSEQASPEENAIFSRIRESEKNQWKNQEPLPQSSALDY